MWTCCDFSYICICIFANTYNIFSERIGFFAVRTAKKPIRNPNTFEAQRWPLGSQRFHFSCSPARFERWPAVRVLGAGALASTIATTTWARATTSRPWTGSTARPPGGQSPPMRYQPCPQPGTSRTGMAVLSPMRTWTEPGVVLKRSSPRSHFLTRAGEGLWGDVLSVLLWKTLRPNSTMR